MWCCSNPYCLSFCYQGSEPWFGTQARISGDFKLASAIASGLPTSEDLENSLDLEMLKSSPIPDGKDLDLLIGIFSTANNFKRRMAIRRTWMQYDAVHNGTVAVRFFVGLVKDYTIIISINWQGFQSVFLFHCFRLHIIKMVQTPDAKVGTVLFKSIQTWW